MPSSDNVRQALLDELLTERFGPVLRRPAPARYGSAAAASMSDASPATVAERQRVLNESLDGAHLVVVDVPEAAA